MRSLKSHLGLYFPFLLMCTFAQSFSLPPPPRSPTSERIRLDRDPVMHRKFGIPSHHPSVRLSSKEMSVSISLDAKQRRERERERSSISSSSSSSFSFSGSCSGSMTFLFRYVFTLSLVRLHRDNAATAAGGERERKDAPAAGEIQRGMSSNSTQRDRE